MSKQYIVTRSFGYALAGLKTAFKNEPNFQIHVAISIFVILLALSLEVALFEWMIIFSTIILVFVLELINTAIEAVVDLISPQIHPKAKIAKDVSAAAVLLTSILALFIGLSIFLPKIISLAEQSKLLQ